jgi:intracellular sulfur oxidation DsrE/DsrF family protein
MKKTLIFKLLFILTSLQALSQTPANPVIQNYGTIYDLEDVVKPDPDQEYKIVIDLKTPVTDPEQVNAGLNNVARMINLHVTGGVPAENIQVAVAIHGGATSTVLDDRDYRKKHGTDNPNLRLIKELKEAGVELYVCGQSILARGYDRKNLNPDIEMALSMLTVVTERMNQGYSILIFQ